MKILWAASEASPFSASGGLGMVTGAVPRYLAKLGHDVRLYIPRHRKSIEGDMPQRPLDLSVDLPIRQYETIKGILYGSHLDINDAAGENIKVPVMLVDNPNLFNRPRMYADGGEPYPDNALRFAFFSRSVLQGTRKQHWIPDIVHSHDWQTGLIPLYGNKMGFDSTKFVFTIHNAFFHGADEERPIGPDFLSFVGLDPALFNPEATEFHELLSFLKAGVYGSDAFTTVSPRYVEELKGINIPDWDTFDYSGGMDGFYRAMAEKKPFAGIPNGLDYEEYNPQTDKALGAFNYSNGASQAAKGMLKEEVQRKYGLKVDPDVMMLSSIGRIDPSQKGFDILLGIIPRLEGKAQMVISGTGDPVLERTLLDLSRQYPSFFHYTHARNENLTRLLLGASNAVVMGSRYEPCGQTQFMGWRYGALLIARDTGGLHDTGIDLNDNPRSGNAFLFQEHTSDAFDGAITRASDMYSQHQGVWQKASIRAMGLRFYWEDVAKKYLELYESLLENPTE